MSWLAIRVRSLGVYNILFSTIHEHFDIFVGQKHDRLGLQMGSEHFYIMDNSISETYSGSQSLERH
jgi:hypothetical protein